MGQYLGLVGLGTALRSSHVTRNTTTSAPVALRRISPSRNCASCGGKDLSRSTEFVPTCQSTRSGCSAITVLSSRASMSVISSPFTPRFKTVISCPGKCRASSSASRLGYAAADVLAPAP